MNRPAPSLPFIIAVDELRAALSRRPAPAARPESAAAYRPPGHGPTPRRR